MKTTPYILVGLGNPGATYEKTFHNIGKMAASYIKKRATEDGYVIKSLELTGYMNQSGAELKKTLRMKNESLAHCIIIHDDVDQLFGAYKIVTAGRSGGHNGVQNIIDVFGTDEVRRLKIGIRDPKERRRKKANEFVLKKISFFKRRQLTQIFEAAYQDLKNRMLSQRSSAQS